MDIGFSRFPKVVGSGIIFRWPTHRSDSGACGTRTRSPAFAPNPRCAVSSVIRRRASSRSLGAQKNGLRVLRALEIEVRRVRCRSCGKVKRERLDFLADNPLYTKRFAHYVGQRCRQATIKDIAEELKLDWDTVKTLEKQYMQAQLARAGRPGPKAIGIDEISIRKGHSYRIVVSDLIRRRPIWFGGEDRSEASMAQFYDWLGQKKSHGIRLAVMDMWKPFRNTTRERAVGPMKE